MSHEVGGQLRDGKHDLLTWLSGKSQLARDPPRSLLGHSAVEGLADRNLRALCRLHGSLNAAATFLQSR